MKEKQFKVIISPIMARYLVKKGFVIKDLKPNKHYPRETCFVFENTKELHEAMTYFQENIRKQKNKLKGAEKKYEK